MPLFPPAGIGGETKAALFSFVYLNALGNIENKGQVAGLE